MAAPCDAFDSMISNFQGISADVSVFLLVLTAFVLVTALVATLILGALGRRRQARVAAAIGIAWAVVYLAALIGFSLISTARSLPLKEAKYFCDTDCHLAYSVVGVERRASIGGVEAKNGEFWIVSLETYFDPRTVSADRAPGPITPEARTADLELPSGKRFGRSARGERAIAESLGAQPPLTTPLAPRQSYVTHLVFDLPPGASPRLWLHDEDPVGRLLIGNEESLLHRRVLFRLVTQ